MGFHDWRFINRNYGEYRFCRRCSKRQYKSDTVVYGDFGLISYEVDWIDFGDD